MPDELTALPEHVLHCVAGGRPIALGFEPPPAALDRIVLRGIRLQVLQCHPRVLLETVFERSTGVPLGLVEEHEEQRLGKPLVELVEEGQERLARPPLGPLPSAALGPERQGPAQRGALALGRGGAFGWGALANPPALAVGCIGQGGRIAPEDCYGALRWTGTASRATCCHPRFFFSRRGALRGTGLAQRV